MEKYNFKKNNKKNQRGMEKKKNIISKLISI
jgi:hypothetical protein